MRALRYLRSGLGLGHAARRATAVQGAHLHGADIAAHLACCRGLGRLERAARATTLAPGRCREGENRHQLWEEMSEEMQLLLSHQLLRVAGVLQHKR